MAKVGRGKPHPRFGATKAQAQRLQQIRDLKNQVFELTEHIKKNAPPNGGTRTSQCQRCFNNLMGDDLSFANGKAEGLLEAMRILAAARVLATGKVTP